MTHRLSYRIGLIVVSLLCMWGPRRCLAQQVKPTIQQISEVWKRRQEKVSTARFQLSCEEILHKGVISYAERKRRKSANLPPENEPNPPNDYSLKGTSVVNLDGCKLRYSYDHQQWDPIGKKLYPEQYVDVFDGSFFKFLQIPASGQKEYPLAAVRKAERSQSALQYAILPLDN